MELKNNPINLIGNSCVSSYIVRDFLNQQFINPFTWCTIKNSDISFIIDNYEKIDWYKYDIGFYKDKNNKCVHFYIDNSFSIYYLHYILSDKETQIDGVNVFSSKIFSVSEKKYTNRVERMLSCNKKPTFLIGGSYESQKPTKEIKDKYDCYDNVIIVQNEDIKENNRLFAKWCWETKLKYIYEEI